MDSKWREILRKHRYERYSLRSGCSCKQFGTTLEANEKKCFEEWLDHINDIYGKPPNTRGKGMERFPVPDDDSDYEHWRIGVGLPPQRSMTPEESANLAAYHKTKFKRVAAQDDGLRELLEEARERMLRQGWAVSVSAGMREFYEKVCAALASEKAAPQCSIVGCRRIGPHEHTIGGPVAAPEDSK